MNRRQYRHACMGRITTILLGLMVCLSGITGERAYQKGNIEARADVKTGADMADAGRETAAVSAGEEAPRIALTFDDGPSDYTQKLLEGLKERGVQATFFLVGSNIEKHEKEVKLLAQDGHLLGNHSYSHKQLNKISGKKACQEIVKTNNLIYECTGIYPMYVRPPFGEWDEELDCGVEMIPIFWNVDSLDWKIRNTDSIVKRVLEQTKDGDVILMHDGYQTSVEAAFQIVDELKKRGFEFVTADKMIVE